MFSRAASTHSFSRRTIATGLALAGLAFSATAAEHADAAGCDATANAGDSVKSFVNSLSSGQTGCLPAGTYDADNQVKFTKANVTLTSKPGERATLVGRIVVAQGADGVKVADLDLDGRNSDELPSPTVNAHDTVFSGNDVTNANTAICFNLGSFEWGRADRTRIENNKIHDCGRLPATNYDHGIYVTHARDTVIENNEIYDNADRGIQLYPDADGTSIRNNVIDGNGVGVIISGNGSNVSENNTVEHNMITNSNVRNNVEGNWPGALGTGNVVRQNCIHGGVRDDGDGGIGNEVGFAATQNVLKNPAYNNRAAKDFSLQAGSPCEDLPSATGTEQQQSSSSNDSGPTSGNDVLVGTGKADKLNGAAGNDIIKGKGSNDKLIGGKGKDTLKGGGGRDVLKARDGKRDIVNCGGGKRDVAKVDKRDRVRGCEKVIR